VEKTLIRRKTLEASLSPKSIHLMCSVYRAQHCLMIKKSHEPTNEQAYYFHVKY